MKLFLKELTLINQLDGRRAFRLDQLKKKPSHDDLKDWVRSGWLKRIAYGVYRIARLEAPDPKLIAALLVPDSYITGMTALEKRTPPERSIARSRVESDVSSSKAEAIGFNESAIPKTRVER